MRFRFWVLLGSALTMAGCGESGGQSAPTDPPVRGLVTTVVQSAEETTRRRFPGVLEPTSITSLSFEVAGKLQAVSLQVGQRVTKGDALASLERTQFEATVESQRASVAEQQALLKQAEDKVRRTRILFRRKTTTKVALDNAETELRTVQAGLVRAERSLVTAEDNLTKTQVFAPYDGIVNSVDVESFQTVAVGTKITSVYEATTYEVSFSVNFATVSRLVVGTPASVRLADDPGVRLAAVVSELGERADTVSSFPVVVQLKETHPLIRAGMAVEVSLEFKVPGARGYLIPITAAITDRAIPEDTVPGKPTPLAVFVFDPETSMVKRREVTMAGIRENRFLVIDGLQPGERVAIAGVSFLREDMRVKLVEPRN
ncbi:MAG: efflux RND transporter periplasmic adaptor subunit [Pseudomonadota bacterium]